jgi:hypothetical protein
MRWRRFEGVWMDWLWIELGSGSRCDLWFLSWKEFLPWRATKIGQKPFFVATAKTP